MTTTLVLSTELPVLHTRLLPVYSTRLPVLHTGLLVIHAILLVLHTGLPSLLHIGQLSESYIQEFQSHIQVRTTIFLILTFPKALLYTYGYTITLIYIRLACIYRCTDAYTSTGVYVWQISCTRYFNGIIGFCQRMLLDVRPHTYFLVYAYRPNLYVFLNFFSD